MILLYTQHYSDTMRNWGDIFICLGYKENCLS